MRIKLRMKHASSDTAIVRWAWYGNGNIAMRVLEPSGEPLAVATVNPGVEVLSPLVVLKNWAENEGVEKALIEAGVIEPLIQGSVTMNHVTAPIYKLTRAALADLANNGG